MNRYASALGGVLLGCAVALSACGTVASTVQAVDSRSVKAAPTSRPTVNVRSASHAKTEPSPGSGARRVRCGGAGAAPIAIAAAGHSDDPALAMAAMNAPRGEVIVVVTGASGSPGVAGACVTVRRNGVVMGRGVTAESGKVTIACDYLPGTSDQWTAQVTSTRVYRGSGQVTITPFGTGE